eukprot:TRINITY_DN4841_c0_g1_i2.p1 TRINITY_DN4841_c0_g1~~TRINITY_DN4841_c0_g1_i2.p1  ORF type:complete len:324 (-),score=66.31 TRINITY_DN4841_c0_g1_i2:127-1098(-)
MNVNLNLWRTLSLITLFYLFFTHLTQSTKQKWKTKNEPEGIQNFVKAPIEIDISDGLDKRVHYLAKSGGRSQQRPEIITKKIKAYVLSMNASAPRFVRTKKILEKCGLYVIHVQPIHHLDPFIVEQIHPSQSTKVYSNRFTLRMVWDWINSDPTIDDMEVPFSLIFEDDIQLNSKIKYKQVPELCKNAARIQQDTSVSGLFYMGTGLGRKWPLCDDTGATTSIFDGVGFSKCNGRLFHATGLLKYEGKWLNDRLNKFLDVPKSHFEYPYMDAVVQLAFANKPWCVCPTVIGYDLTDERSQKGALHVGIFFQDRDSFKSEIDNR